MLLLILLWVFLFSWVFVLVNNYLFASNIAFYSIYAKPGTIFKYQQNICLIVSGGDHLILYECMYVWLYFDKCKTKFKQVSSTTSCNNTTSGDNLLISWIAPRSRSYKQLSSSPSIFHDKTVNFKSSSSASSSFCLLCSFCMYGRNIVNQK